MEDETHVVDALAEAMRIERQEVTNYAPWQKLSEGVKDAWRDCAADVLSLLSERGYQIVKKGEER